MINSDDLINKVKSYNKFLNPDTLTKAYEFALKAHKHQKRHSGDPYVIHPVAVADILTDLKLDSATIATGLLHDTIEDTHATYKTIEEEVEALIEQAERDEQNTTTARFIRNFETRVYAKLSQQLVDKLFGETAQDNGTIELEGNTIDYKVDETNITLTVTNEANKQTVITFPLNSFTF